MKTLLGPAKARALPNGKSGLKKDPVDKAIKENALAVIPTTRMGGCCGASKEDVHSRDQPTITGELNSGGGGRSQIEVALLLLPGPKMFFLAITAKFRSIRACIAPSWPKIRASHCICRTIVLIFLRGMCNGKGIDAGKATGDGDVAM